MRPFLSTLLKQASEAGCFPGDYFLVLGKYDSSSSCLVPRSQVSGFLDIAKTPARRRKYERFLASPCEKNDLLVLVCAGDHVEGHWMRVPALVPAEPRVAANEVTKKDVELYLRFHLPRLVDEMKKDGGRLGDHVIVLRLPNHDPVLLRRAAARPSLLGAGFGEDVLGELEKPAEDDEIFCVFRVNGELQWFRGKAAFRQVGDDEHTADLMRRLMEQWLHHCYDTVREMGENPSDYVAYARVDMNALDDVRPVIFPRAMAAEGKELAHLRGTKKLEQLLAHLEVPCPDVLLALDFAHLEDISVVWRDEDKIPRFPMTKRVSMKRDD